MAISRRSFVKLSSVAVMTAAVAPKISYAADSAPKKIRVGVVGGRFGLSFQFHEHPDCVVEAVSDLRAERLAALQKTYKCDKGYESLEKLILDPKIDAVAIFTPAPEHVKHCVAAMKAGKHVLCAVPAAYTIDECHELLNTVKSTALTYMQAETSYWQQLTISARKFYRDGAFGRLYFAESEYHHPGLEVLFVEDGKRTWRYGYPPMHYPTHCTAHLLSVSGERLSEVSCIGWGDDDPILRDNVYHNPFWNETALFQTNRGNGFRVAVWWRGAMRGTERAQFYGDKMSFFFNSPNGLGPVIIRSGKLTEKDAGNFERSSPQLEKYEPVAWWKTDLLPESLRHDSGHEGSHCFITHEFIDSLVHNRMPATNVHEALAFAAPGIIAHESALKGGERMKIPTFD